MRTINIKRFACVTVAAILLAACANDEVAFSTVQDLPEGMYPLQIAGVSLTAESTAEPWGANAPQTRVSENTTDGNSSIWDGGETIGVQLSGSLSDGTPYTSKGEYTISSDGTVTPVSGKEVYWCAKGSATITAWYPTNGVIYLASQDTGLKYALKATASNVAYNSAVNLNFVHLLSKIRVELTGTADMVRCTVKVQGKNTGTFTDGSLTGVSDGWIGMKESVYYDGSLYYEANVIPGPDYYSLYENAFEITPKNKPTTKVTLDAPVNVYESGKIYRITLTVNAK